MLDIPSPEKNAASNNNDKLKDALRQASQVIKDLLAENNALKSKTPIAIIGMSCRFPGGANNPQLFWEMLKNAQDGISEVPIERWDKDLFLGDGLGEQGKMYTAQGGFLNIPIDEFDAAFFGISPNEARAMDPQHRLLLELSWEALENANIPPEGLKNSRTGVYIGISGDDYALNHRHSHEPCAIDAYSITGSTFSTAAGRISYILGLQGPCMAIDTACSSSLVALHQACRSLQANESNLALVGGVNLIIHPEMHIGFSKLQAISPNGRCKTFDASANGYVRSEGCSMIVLKRLEDALQNRDHILAVVEGSAINQDGKTNGLAAPNGLAQQAVITEALQNARILPNQVQYLEAHGTGTILGDPIEVEALGATYGLNRSSTLFLGSVKTNIGHLEPVAGMAGILKIILSLNNQILPKNLHFQNPNPHIQWETLPFEVLQKNEVWPLTNQVTRYAAVSSFGFSGTNAHVILSESPLPLPTLTKLKQPTQVILLSAKDKKSLQELVNVYLAEMQKRAIDLDALSFSTACGRTHWQERLAFIVSSQNDLINQLQSYLINESKHDLIFKQGIDHKNQLAILFTGQGSQYHRMGCDLYESELVFKNAFLECNDILEPIIQQSIKRLLFEENSELIHQTEFTQPLLFAIEYSLYQLWKSWGVHPQYLMGHSVGEYVAACVADVFSLQDGLHLIAKRGQLMQALPKGGGMLAVLASVEELTPYLLTYENKIDIAAINGVNQTVLAGKLVDLERLETTLNDQQLSAQLLSVSHAFHSFLMQDMLEDYRKILSTIRFSSPKIPIISNLTGDIADHAITSVDYWLKHVMQPVEFVKGVQTLEKLGINTILEIGPDPTLIGLAKKLLPPATLFLPSLKRQTVDTEQMLGSLGKLFMSGHKILWQSFFNNKPQNWLNIPGYQFQRKSFWTSPSQIHLKSFALQKPLKNIEPFDLQLQKWESPFFDKVIFSSYLNAQKITILHDHQVLNQTVVAASFHINLIVQAYKNMFTKLASFHLFDLIFYAPLLIPESGTISIQLAIEKELSQSNSFEMISLSGSNEKKQTHVSGQFKQHHKQSHQLKKLSEFLKLWEEQPHSIPGKFLYGQLLKREINLGPQHQWIHEFKKNTHQTLAVLESPGIHQDMNFSYTIHPGLLDAAFCLLADLVPVGEGKTFLPFSIKEMHLSRIPTGDKFYAWAVINLDQSQKINGEIVIFDEQGNLILNCLGIEGREIAINELQKILTIEKDSLKYETQWEHSPSKYLDVKNFQTFLFFAYQNSWVEDIVSKLRMLGMRVIVIHPADGFEVLNIDKIFINPLNPSCYEDLFLSLQQDCVIDHILYGWGIEYSEQFLETIQKTCKPLFNLMQYCSIPGVDKPTQLTVITQGSQVIQDNICSEKQLQQLPLWGLAKTISLEFSEINCHLIDLDPSVGLMHQTNLFLDEISNDYSQRVTIPKSGNLTDLIWEPQERPAPGLGEVEIEVAAAGLNFKDVLLSLHRVPSQSPLLGVECSGTITRIGPDVKHFQIGQRVIAMVPGCFARFVCAPSQTTVPMPEKINFSTGAALPIAFLTAAYALHSLGRLQAGERVLIHAATGGVGQAAIQIAQRAGAIVFATASLGKWSVLKSLGVEYIFDSRTAEFESAIVDLTDGKGVDLVLNSLRGELTDAGLRLLRPGGRFLEIGITDLRQAEELEQIAPGIAYYPIDLMQIYRDDPGILESLFADIMEQMATDELRALPVQTFAASQIEQAFRTMQLAKHTGKLVLTLENSASQPLNEEVAFRGGQRLTPQFRKSLTKVEKNSYEINREGHYVIFGGLGSIGLEIAKNLINQNARHITLTGRKEPQDENLLLLNELRGSGANVQVCLFDVCDSKALAEFILSFQSNSPIKGIFYASGILDDALIAKTTWERFENGLLAKTVGAQLVHQLTCEMNLDFFIGFSSLASQTGSIGQASYVAGNCYLDGLMKYRHQIGKPSHTINWGPWENTGMFKRLGTVQVARLKALGIEPIKISQALVEINQLGPQSPAQQSIADIQWGHFLEKFPKAFNNSFYRHHQLELSQLMLEEGPSIDLSTTTEDSWLSQLTQAPTTQRHTILIGFLQKSINQIIGASPSDLIALRQPLFELGIDSLTAVELKNRLEKLLNCSLSSTLLFDYPTLESLAQHLEYQMPSLFDQNKDEVVEDATENKDVSTEFDDLSDAELMQLLNGKL